MRIGQEQVLKAVTADDVARLAGVSRSAVSRTFSGNGFVSQQKRERILQAAKQLDYRPNTLASNLASRQSNQVALVINPLPDFRSPYFYNGLITGVQDAGYFPLMVFVDPHNDGFHDIHHTLSYPVHGVIVIADSVQPSAVATVDSRRRPILLNNNWSGSERVDTVMIDQRTGIAEMVSELARTGHQKVAYIGGRPTSAVAQDRRSAFIDAIVSHDMRLVAEGTGDFIYECAYGEALRILDANQLPDVVICANDVMAFAAIDAARTELGLRIPEAVSIVGFDDVPLCRWKAYDLSTVGRSDEELIALILSMLDKPSEDPRQARIKTKFVRRGTIADRT